MKNKKLRIVIVCMVTVFFSVGTTGLALTGYFSSSECKWLDDRNRDGRKYLDTCIQQSPCVIYANCYVVNAPNGFYCWYCRAGDNTECGCSYWGQLDFPGHTGYDDGCRWGGDDGGSSECYCRYDTGNTTIHLYICDPT